MKGFFGEFKEFISKGNVLDMAVGVIIGGAFGEIVNAFVVALTQAITAFTPSGDLKFDQLTWRGIEYGKLINAIISFLIIAFAVFLIVKAANKFKKEEVVDPTEKECPYCLSKINIKAVKCPHCTSDVADVK
ncbi:MAG: large conductance mechanosensitive channel protein MscL [Lachnospiraceae bacterium]|nr:large conductance mechanosensitive channel protein MscL [Lachnospiraceae bacterium]